MMKRFIVTGTIIFILFHVSLNSVGQVFSTPGLSGAYASPSANQSSLQSDQAQNKVDNFTGSKNITLPIFNFESNGFILPISLNYNTSGVKVSDIASWVGLKWNLSYGGIITRSVKDKPDELTAGRIFNKEYNNFDNDAKIASINDDNNYANLLNLYAFGNGTGQWDLDKEPDIFTYNINGESGKFTLDQDGKVKLIPYKNVTIIPEITSAGWNIPLDMARFTVIDDKGVSYVFDIKETTNSYSYGWAGATRAAQFQDYNETTLQYTTAWYLSKIILPISYLSNNSPVSKEINLTYTDETYIVEEPSTIWMRSCINVNCSLGLFASGSPNAIINTTETVSAKRLTTIEDENTIVNFVGENVREDLANTYRLDSIIVSKKYPIQKEANRFFFNYHYYIGQGSGNKRLMLENVGTISDPANIASWDAHILYGLEYDESASMPTAFNTYELDFWGYYNGNGASSIFPKLYIYPNEAGNDRYSLFPKPGYTNLEIILDGADRNPNPNTIGLGTLTKILYKTGGYTKFEYEPNDFYYEGENHLGSGIRIKKTIVYDGIDAARNIIKEFTYRKSSNTNNSSGLLIDMPIFAVPENTHPNIMGTLSTIGVTDPLDEQYYIDFLIRKSQPVFTSSSVDGAAQGYTEIVEKNTDNSKVFYKYSLPGYYKQEADDQQGVNCFLDTDGYCDGLFKRYFSNYCAESNFNISPDLAGYDFTTNSIFPYGPATNYGWNRGLLLETKFYDADNFLVRENKYNYKLYFPEGKTAPDLIPGIKISLTDNWKLDPSNNWTTNTMGSTYAGLNFFAKYDILTEVSKVVDTKTEKLYDKSNPGQSSQIQTSYYYDGLYHNYPTRVVHVDSKGVEKIEENTYAFDLKAIPNFEFPETYPQKGYKALLYKNINALIKQREIIKYPGSSNENVVSGNINYYDADIIDHYRLYSTVLLKEQKVLRLSAPVLKSTLTDNITSNGVFVDTRYKQEVLFTKYDDNGNLLEYSNPNEKQSTIWGYNNAYPVAQVKNAIYSDISYTSFETSEAKGGWNYDGAMVDDVTSPTGNKCNNVANIYIDKNGLDINKTYIVSYWGKNNQNTSVGLPGTVKQGLTINGWTYYEHTITGTSYLIFASQVDYFIDELRLYPKNAQMVTSTYEPLIGVTSECDVNNNITYYEYDVLGRLHIIKDKYRNILKTYDYRFKYSY